jgi:hypothetical protein
MDQSRHLALQSFGMPFYLAVVQTAVACESTVDALIQRMLHRSVPGLPSARGVDLDRAVTELPDRVLEQARRENHGRPFGLPPFAPLPDTASAEEQAQHLAARAEEEHLLAVAVVRRAKEAFLAAWPEPPAPPAPAPEPEGEPAVMAPP